MAASKNQDKKATSPETVDETMETLGEETLDVKDIENEVVNEAGAKADADAPANAEANQAAEAEDEAAANEAADAETVDDFEELLQLKAEVQDWQDKYMRLHAEWDTYRRRMKEQQSQDKARATEKLMEDLLPVIDDFERTIDYANKNGEAGLLTGVEAVRNKFTDMLAKHGLEEINPKGEAFDALAAQAVATVEDTEAYEETVAEVYQKGYKMGDHVLRAAMVTVTTGGPTRPAEEAEAEEE